MEIPLPAPFSQYFFIARARVLAALAYRFEVAASFVGRFVILAGTLFVWRAIYAGQGTAAGVDLHGMEVYVVLSAVLAVLLDVQVPVLVNERVRSGDISVDFLRPVPLPSLWLAHDAGMAFARLLVQGAALFAGAALLVGPPLPAGPAAFVLFLPSALLAFLIVWLMAASVALISFWTVELGSLRVAHHAVLRFLSGSIVPVWFFPHGFQEILRWLPFVYTYQAPIGIYIGRTRGREALSILLLQGGWGLLLGLLFLFLWGRARRRVVVQGG